MKKDLKIVFVGGKDRGYECLKLLREKQTPIHIFCMPEDKHEKVKFFPKKSLNLQRIKKFP